MDWRFFWIVFWIVMIPVIVVLPSSTIPILILALALWSRAGVRAAGDHH